ALRTMCRHRIAILELPVIGRQYLAIMQMDVSMAINQANMANIAIGNLQSALLPIGLEQELVPRSDFDLFLQENPKGSGLFAGEGNFIALIVCRNQFRFLRSEDGQLLIAADVLYPFVEDEHLARLIALDLFALRRRPIERFQPIHFPTVITDFSLFLE